MSDHGMFTSDDHIGDVQIPLDKANLHMQPTQYIMKIRPNKKLATEKKFRGEIQVSLCYDQRFGKLTVNIKQCRNLKPIDGSSGSCDPYVKLLILYHGRRIEKRKTEPKVKEVNPVYDEKIDVDVPVNRVRDYMLVFQVMQYDNILNNRPIGEVSIGYRTSGAAQKQWTDMLTQPKLPIVVWHTLGNVHKYHK